MSTGHLSISHLYTRLEHASNKEMAEVLSEAFEKITMDHQQALVQNKVETLTEINSQNLATKADISELKLNIATVKLEIHKEISTAKWQVIGSIGALVLIQIVLKHFGF